MTVPIFIKLESCRRQLMSKIYKSVAILEALKSLLCWFRSLFCSSHPGPFKDSIKDCICHHFQNCVLSNNSQINAPSSQHHGFMCGHCDSLYDNRKKFTWKFYQLLRSNALEYIKSFWKVSQCIFKTFGFQKNVLGKTSHCWEGSKSKKLKSKLRWNSGVQVT